MPSTATDQTIDLLDEIVNDRGRSDTRDAALALIEREKGTAKAGMPLSDALTLLDELVSGNERSDTRDFARMVIQRYRTGS